MSQLRNINYQKLIAFLLLVNVFALFVLPVQIHIHHDLNMDGQVVHIVDYHTVVNEIDVDHLSQGNPHVLKTSNDFITKQFVDDFFNIAGLVILFLIMSAKTFLYYQRRYHAQKINYQKYYSLSPPLRAPPL